MKKLSVSLIAKCYGLLFNLYVLISPEKTAHWAFHVFAKVRSGRVRPDQEAYLEAAKKEVVTAEGHNIQVYEWKGNRATVLLVHGWESNSWRWHKLIEKLEAAGFHILAFDAPAHGHSSGTHLYVPLYAAALQVMIKRYQPVHLVGHSVGGMTLLYNEYKNPCERIEKMITIGSPSEFHEIMAHYQELLGFNDNVLDALDHYIKKRFGISIQEFSSAQFVKNNTKKGLLFHDRYDSITPYHASVDVQRHWQGSTLVTTEGFGHSMHQDVVNEKIIVFLDE
jgi:pimeloyl-ACP methyl ester carboxylesterase